MIWKEKGANDIAIADFNEAIRLDPKSAAAFFNRGDAWYRKEAYDKAIADFNENLRLEPNHTDGYLSRAVAWMMKREYDKALSDHNEAVRLEPKNARLYSLRGVLHKFRRDYDKAIADYNEAIRLDPNLASAYMYRASIWATCPESKYRDGKRAVESATRACELFGWRNPWAIDDFAAAYAETGDFAKAVEWQGQATKLYADSEKKKQGEDRIKLYQDKKPYRDSGN